MQIKLIFQQKQPFLTSLSVRVLQNFFTVYKDVA